MNLFAFNHLLKQFSNDVNNNYTYKFKIVDKTEFNMILTYKAKSKILDNVYKQVARAIKKTGKTKGAGNPSLIQQFEIPEQFLNRVHTSVLKHIKAINKHELNPDGYTLMRTNVFRCIFKRDGTEDLTIIVYVGGIYARI